MDRAGEFVISITAAAILVGVLTGLTDRKDTFSTLIRMIGGLFLAFTAIRPLVSLEIVNIGAYIDAFSLSGTAAAENGENIAQDAYCSYIISRTEAYILDKAEGYGASLTVEVSLSSSEAPVPESVRIRGQLSPYAKLCLQEMMEQELGISKENQIWIG